MTLGEPIQPIISIGMKTVPSTMSPWSYTSSMIDALARSIARMVLTMNSRPVGAMM